jgi:hypothetical protein
MVSANVDPLWCAVDLSYFPNIVVADGSVSVGVKVRPANYALVVVRYANQDFLDGGAVILAG